MTKTVHIPLDLHRECRIAAATANVKLGDFVADLLRTGLGAPSEGRCKPNTDAGDPLVSPAIPAEEMGSREIPSPGTPLLGRSSVRRRAVQST